LVRAWSTRSRAAIRSSTESVRARDEFEQPARHDAGVRRACHPCSAATRSVRHTRLRRRTSAKRTTTSRMRSRRRSTRGGATI
jgi:hypothetical protein